LIPVFVVIS